MNRIRVLRFAYRRAQRLGFLKKILSLASPEKSSTQQILGDSFLSCITKKYPVPVSGSVSEYFDRVFTGQHFSDIKGQLNSISSRNSDELIPLELQDIYLSDRSLPSRRGRLVKDDSVLLPGLAESLGLLTPNTSILTSRGKLLLSQFTPEEISAFEMVAAANPLVLTREQKISLLFYFLQEDGNILMSLYPFLANTCDQITDVIVGDKIGDQLTKLISNINHIPGASRDKEVILSLSKTAVTIRSWKGKPYSGKGARDEWATIRLEPFVDLGILKKPDPFSYKYELTEAGRGFANALEQTTDIDEFLSKFFMKTVARMLAIQITNECSKADALKELLEANRIIRNNIGYSDIIDTSLLAGINSLINNRVALEIDQSIRIVREYQREKPNLIHFGVDRWGDLKFVNFRAQ